MGDIPVIKEPKIEKVTLKPLSAGPGQCIQTDDDEDVIVDKNRRGSNTSFNAMTAFSVDKVDGKQREVLVTFQVDTKKKDHFLCPKKPKDSQTKVKVRCKKVKVTKVFDREDKEIEGKSRKYWFKVKATGDDSYAYESLAYEHFFMSAEYNKVVLRKCSEDIPSAQKFHIDINKIPGRFLFRKRTGLLPLYREVAKIENCILETIPPVMTPMMVQMPTIHIEDTSSGVDGSSLDGCQNGVPTAGHNQLTEDIAAMSNRTPNDTLNTDQPSSTFESVADERTLPSSSADDTFTSGCTVNENMNVISTVEDTHLSGNTHNEINEQNDDVKTNSNGLHSKLELTSSAPTKKGNRLFGLFSCVSPQNANR